MKRDWIKKGPITNSRGKNRMSRKCEKRLLSNNRSYICLIIAVICVIKKQLWKDPMVLFQKSEHELQNLNFFGPRVTWDFHTLHTTLLQQPPLHSPSLLSPTLGSPLVARHHLLPPCALLLTGIFLSRKNHSSHTLSKLKQSPCWLCCQLFACRFTLKTLLIGFPLYVVMFHVSLKKRTAN